MTGAFSFDTAKVRTVRLLDGERKPRVKAKAICRNIVINEAGHALLRSLEPEDTSAGLDMDAIYRNPRFASLVRTR